MNPRVAIAIKADYDGRWAAQVVNDAGRVATGVQKAGQQAAQSMQAANLNTANLAAQFNDIGVMLASGQSPLLLALQQGTQVAQALGPVGVAGAAKALGAAFMSVISPLNLITIGTIALGAAAAQWLMGVNQEAPKAEDALKRHDEWLKRILVGYDDAAAAAVKAADATLKLPQAAVVSDLGAKAKSDTDAYRASLEALKAPFDYLEDKTKKFWEAQDAISQADAIAQLQQQLDLNNPRLDEFVGQLTEIKNSAVNEKIAAIAESLITAALAAQTAATQVAQTNAALNSIKFPALPAGYTDAMKTLGKLATPAETDRDRARMALNEGLLNAREEIERAAVRQQYEAAIARIGAEEEARKPRTIGTGTGGSTRSAGGQAIESMLDVMKETRSEAQKLADTISSSLATSVTGLFTTIRSGGDAMGYLANQLGNVADQLLNNALQSLFGSLFGGFSFGGGIGGIGGGLGSTAGGAVSRLPFGPPRAAGGPVSAGVVYPVGEMGPELFVPQSAGTIIPNHKLGGAAGGGGTTTVRIELGEGLVAKVLDRAGRQTVQIVQSITPGMIKSQAPAAVASAQRNGTL